MGLTTKYGMVFNLLDCSFMHIYLIVMINYKPRYNVHYTVLIVIYPDEQTTDRKMDR